MDIEWACAKSKGLVPGILLLSLSHSDNSVSRSLAEPLAHALQDAGANTELFDARTLPPMWVRDTKLDGAPPPYHVLRRLIAGADGVILIHPIYAYTSSSASKAVLELYGDVLNGKAVAFASASSTPRSYLAVASSIVSAIFDAGAYCHPRTLQAVGEAPDELGDRITEFATGFTRFTAAVAGLHAQDWEPAPVADRALLARPREHQNRQPSREPRIREHAEFPGHKQPIRLNTAG
jgi:NAD(P)H-dependent FMN reductase